MKTKEPKSNLNPVAPEGLLGLIILFIKGLLAHINLLMTFRHNGVGLPRGMGAVLVICSLYVFAGVFRWLGTESILLTISGLLILPFLMNLISFRLAVGYMLISFAVDLMTVNLTMLNISDSGWFCYELIALMALGHGIIRHEVAEQ